MSVVCAECGAVVVYGGHHDGCPWNNEPSIEEYPPCPICGDPIDYCLGHGEANTPEED